MAIISAAIIVPAFFLVQSVGFHVLSAMRLVQSGAAEREIRHFLDNSPRISAELQYSMDNATVSQAFDRSAGFVAGQLGAALGGSFNALIQIVIMLFLLFFLYRDGETATTRLRAIVPLSDEETDDVFAHLVRTVRVTVLGRFTVAGIQGIVAGIAFACLRVPAPQVLGALTLLVAMMPPLGASVVWVSVVIYLAATQYWVQATILVLIGSLVISTLDNVLHPVLVGTRLRLHTVPIFLSIVGEIWLLGISGLILGPAAFALAHSFLGIWRKRLKFTVT